MRIVAVVLNYRTAEMTLDAVRACRTALAFCDHRIDVVDNDSGDGSYEHLSAAVEEEGWSDVRVLQSGHNGGFGAGNNYALRSALEEDPPPDYLYILNSDAFPDPDAVEALAACLEEHPDAGIAGSAIRGTDGEPHTTAFRFPSVQSELISGFRLGLLTGLLRDREVTIRPTPESTRDVDWLAGASMMLRPSMLEQIGLFDETFFLYFEETDLCRRARRAGWRVLYVVESRVAHVGHGSTGMKDRSRPMPAYWFDSRKYYFTKNHGRAYALAADLARASGLLTYRVRAPLQGKANEDHKHFLRDFLRHSFLGGHRGADR
jgi:N-acetylglucosaminyl-diphospho-decaprenol L-rhamnosyltransferase